MSHYINSINLIFIHVPKTGGSFIEKHLEDLAKIYNEHRQMTSHWTINKYSNMIDKYVVFGVIRNPYNRIMSAYNMFQQSGWHGVIKNTHNKLNNPNNFESFIQNIYLLFKRNELPWQTHDNEKIDKVCSSSKDLAVHIIPQYYYFMNHENKIGINKDNILKYETLDKDMERFLDNNYKNNETVQSFFKKNIISKINIKQNYDIPKVYPNLVNMIYEIYEIDFTTFDYTK